MSAAILKICKLCNKEFKSLHRKTVCNRCDRLKRRIPCSTPSCTTLINQASKTCIPCRYGPVPKLSKLTETELAYVAGLLEGEGTFPLKDKNPKKAVIRCEMTDLDVIQNLHKLLGVGTIIVPTKRGKDYYKQSYIWHITRQEVVKELGCLLYPYMSPRRQSQIEQHWYRDDLKKNNTWFSSDEAKWAWLAGELEGEGTFDSGRTNPAKVHFTSTDMWTLNKAQIITQRGHIYKKKTKKDHWTDASIWIVQDKKNALLIANKVLPYLGSRRTSEAKSMLLATFRHIIKVRINKRRAHLKVKPIR